MRPALARTIWHHVEAINAVAYFSPESGEAAAGLGLKGFWMGYFGFRAAPLGQVGSAVVEATFFNFHPDRVRRAIPDAWRYTSPGEILAVRSPAAAASADTASACPAPTSITRCAPGASRRSASAAIAR